MFELSDSIMASLSTKHVFKQKEKNLKCQTGKSGTMKAEKCVAARLTKCRTRQNVRTDLKRRTPLLSSCPSSPPSFLSEHEYMCFYKLWVCACTCAMQAVCVSCGHGLQTEFVSRHRTPELFWPPPPMHPILMSALHVEVCKPRSPGHIPPTLWHSAPGLK